MPQQKRFSVTDNIDLTWYLCAKTAKNSKKLADNNSGQQVKNVCLYLSSLSLNFSALGLFFATRPVFSSSDQHAVPQSKSLPLLFHFFT